MMDSTLELMSTSSRDEYDDENEANVIINGGNIYTGIAHNSKEGKLKGIPSDITYSANFAGKTPEAIYDEICVAKHFGHVANRVLRKMIAGNYIDEKCGTTLGKNRKVRNEQRTYFENLTHDGIIMLHNILKQELESPEALTPILIPPPVPVQQVHEVIVPKKAAAKRPLEVITSSSGTATQASVPTSSSGNTKRVNYESMTKTDLVEVIQSAFKGGRHLELQSQAIAKENAEKAHFLALEKATTLDSKRKSIVFLQEQLKEPKQLSAAQKKEYEAKLEELKNTIAAEM